MVLDASPSRAALSRNARASSGISSVRDREWRQANRRDVEPEIEIFAKQALSDQRPQIAAGGRDHADVWLATGSRIDRRLGAVEHAQQSGLGVEWHVADLVKKQCAAVGLDQLPGVVPAVSEKLGVNAFTRNSGERQSPRTGRPDAGRDRAGPARPRLFPEPDSPSRRTVRSAPTSLEIVL